MEIRKVPISLLNAAPYNPRKDLQPGDPEISEDCPVNRKVRLC